MTDVSHVIARRGTFAALAARRPQPPRRYSQAEHRERRRIGLPAAHYDGTWSLAREIAEQCTPLAQQIAADARPSRFLRSTATVAWLAEVVHEAVGDAVGWVTEGEARAKTKHLANEPGKRKYAITTLVDLAPRPALPEITDDMLASGEWAAALVAMAETVDAEFSALLARSHPPDAPALRGQPSRSDMLARLLARTIDHAALALTRRLDRDDPADRHQDRQTPDDRARAELAAMGVQTA